MVRAGIVGLGKWGKHLVSSIRGSSKIQFVRACTLDLDLVAEFASEYSLRVTDDLRSLVRDTEIDAFVIATPHSLHRAHIEQVVTARKPIFIEKPLALNKSDALACKLVSRSSGVPLVIGYNWRHEPAVKALIQIVREGRIGTPVHLEGNYSGPSAYRRSPGSWRLDRKENPAGAMAGRGIHVLNIMNWIAGPVESVFAFNDKHGEGSIEDTTTALLRFRSGITGYIGSTQISAEYWRLQVFGSKGWVEMRMETEVATCRIDDAPQVIRFERQSPERAELEDFADRVRTKNFDTAAVDAAIDDVAVLEAIDLSSARYEMIYLDEPK